MAFDPFLPYTYGPLALQLLLAVPAGWLADRYRRDSVLRGAAAVGAFAGEGSSAAGHLCHTVSVHGLPEDAASHSRCQPRQTSNMPFRAFAADALCRALTCRTSCPAATVYCWVLFTDAPVIMLYVALGLIGGYRGFNNPAVESIFADSVATGQRCAGRKPATIAYVDAVALGLGVRVTSAA